MRRDVDSEGVSGFMLAAIADTDWGASLLADILEDALTSDHEMQQRQVRGTCVFECEHSDLRHSAHFVRVQLLG